MVAPIQCFTILFKHVETTMCDTEICVECLNPFKSVDVFLVRFAIHSCRLAEGRIYPKTYLSLRHSQSSSQVR